MRARARERDRGSIEGSLSFSFSYVFKTPYAAAGPRPGPLLFLAGGGPGGGGPVGLQRGRRRFFFFFFGRFFFFSAFFFRLRPPKKKKKKTLAAFEPFLARLRPPSGQIPALPTSLAGARPRPVASCIAIGWETCGGNRLFSVRRKERLASLPRARDALFSIPPIFYSHVPTLSSTRSINSPLTG